MVAQIPSRCLDRFRRYGLCENGVLHSVGSQGRQIRGTGIVLRRVQTVGVGKMGIPQPQYPRLVVHHANKALHCAAAVNGQRHRGIIAGGKHKSV